jgi:hypothetical protein
MKKCISLLLLVFFTASFSFSVDLNGFATDFEALMNNVTRKISPALQMNSLSGNIIGDATIDKFVFTFPAIGISTSDGIASILEPGAYEWSLISFPELIESQLGLEDSDLDIMNMIETRLMVYPSIKIGFGFALPKNFDVIMTGMVIPGAAVSKVIETAVDTSKDLDISFGFLNFGIEARKTIIKDSRKTPALSLGLLYNYEGFNLGSNQFSLSGLTGEKMDIEGEELELEGILAFDTRVHNFGGTVHLSKHLLFFTPYIKLSGIWQHSVANNTTDLTVTIASDKTNIKTNPEIIINQFSTIVTTGFDIDIFAFKFNINAMIDLARFDLDLGGFDFGVMKGRGFSLNTGFRLQF